MVGMYLCIICNICVITAHLQLQIDIPNILLCTRWLRLQTFISHSSEGQKFQSW
jgi:hypothetical protein